jgi:hypothetical protein
VRSKDFRCDLAGAEGEKNFEADSSTRVQALTGARILAARKHPLLADIRPTELLEKTHTPLGLHERYTALLWAIADEVLPGIAAHIDEYGAYVFRFKADSSLLAGDASGTFAYYAYAAALRKRLLVALSGPT